MFFLLRSSRRPRFVPRRLLSAGLQVDGDDLRQVPRFLSRPPSVALLGAPQELGQPLAGTARGPALLRKAGLREMLASIGWRVEDRGDVAMMELSSVSASSWSAAQREAVLQGSRRLFERAKEAHLDGRPWWRWAATTAFPAGRWRRPWRRGRGREFCGSTRTPTPTRRRRLPRETSTACPWRTCWASRRPSSSTSPASRRAASPTSASGTSTSPKRSSSGTSRPAEPSSRR
mmetsp:Transcript_29326/g.94614  ORF Transcript_29326/g.94614 Transcript_29326/m.94614 type:complete len:232 (+) Transcript_29326:88-783(+)